MNHNMLKVLFVVLVVSAVALAMPQYADSDAAATGDHHGRVQIKVYRGPSDGHEHFAPWGYWVKQPADDDH